MATESEEIEINKRSQNDKAIAEANEAAEKNEAERLKRAAKKGQLKQ